ncbi:TPA: hypothetical protein NG570_003039 [Vibrio parahaemolyticus]|nr:hypothetical protein [Vibrio parahaemolyticus]MBE5130239.1 hypothetical protein [Vibrio parahaemolyticus]HAV1372930.1 hypothetical protein [Vibrio parahaemolyticus]HCE2195084.1 hypothetical protein [Vibrio parahaemolyticus]HCE3297698.1 hypothetical protein [Vibrio parahaemolyticus]
MSISDFLNEYLLNLSTQLSLSNTYLTLFAASFGAVVGVFLTVVVGWISGYFQTISYNRIARIQVRDLASDNISRCTSNIGVLNNELSRLNARSGRMTLTGISNLIDYQPLLLQTPAKFKSPELFLLRMQISALNTHHAQLVNIVKLRDSLSIEIRKAPEGQQEWELVGLRLEYDRYLLKKYQEIMVYTKTLFGFVEMSLWQRVKVNFSSMAKLEDKLEKLNSE